MKEKNNTRIAHKKHDNSCISHTQRKIKAQTRSALKKYFNMYQKRSAMMSTKHLVQTNITQPKVENNKNVILHL